MTLGEKLAGNPIVVGCNYHVRWQSHKAMRFVLAEVKGDKAKLVTKTTKKEFWAEVSHLIFIRSNHNLRKARAILFKEMIEKSK